MAAMALASSSFAQEFTNETTLKQLITSNRTTAVANRTAAIKWAAAHGMPDRVRVNNFHYRELVGLLGRRPLYRETISAAGSKTLRVDELWPGGTSGYSLTGLPFTNNTLGIFEVGGVPMAGHPEFQGRLDEKDGVTYVSDHATHVAGIMIAAGLDSRAKGMSFQAHLTSYLAYNDLSDAANEALSGMRASNHSYAQLGGWVYGWFGDAKWAWLGDTAVDKVKDGIFGRYDSSSAAWDRVLYNAPFYLPVAGSANNRNPGVPKQPFDHWVYDANGAKTSSQDVRDDQSGYDLIPGSLQISKNSLTVGAVEALKGSYTNPASVIMSDFSSWGPADDGRVKPDICGNGVQVFSTVSYGSGYDTYDGTSMAGPNIAGALGLLIQQYRTLHPGLDMYASTLKGLTIHTAEEAGPDDGPDYMYGWGLMNARAAADLINDASFDPSKMQEVKLNSGSTMDLPISVASGGDVKVTICWTDPAGTANNTKNDDRTPVLVNDIDLRVIRDSDAHVFQPWVLDPANPSDAATTGDNHVDNVEQVVIKNAQAGTYTIHLSHKGAALKPGGSQLVSVLVSAPTPTGFTDLSATPDDLIGGIDNATATLVLTQPFDTSVDVKLVSSNPKAAEVPSSITVPAGVNSVQFPVVTHSVRPVTGFDSVPVIIKANSVRGSRSTDIVIRPITIAGLSFNPAVTPGGTTITGTVTLNSAAPKNGATIVLTSSSPNTARSARNWVIVKEGQTSATFLVRTFAVADDKTVTISASRLGTTIDTPLLVRKPQLATIASTTGVVRGGRTLTLTATMDGVAPTGGTYIPLTTSDAGALPVPASIFIAAGKKSGSVTLTAAAVTGETPVTITASRLTQKLSLNITVVP